MAKEVKWLQDVSQWATAEQILKAYGIAERYAFSVGERVHVSSKVPIMNGEARGAVVEWRRNAHGGYVMPWPQKQDAEQFQNLLGSVGIPMPALWFPVYMVTFDQPLDEGKGLKGAEIHESGLQKI